MDTYVMFFASIVLTIIGFFIVRFFNSVDKISKAVDAINQKLAVRDENMKEIKEDVHEIRLRQHDHSNRLHQLDIQLAKNK